MALERLFKCQLYQHNLLLHPLWDAIYVFASIGECVVFVDQLEKVHEFSTRGCEMRNGAIEFISVGGNIGIFTISTHGFETRKIKQNINIWSITLNVGFRESDVVFLY